MEEASSLFAFLKDMLRLRNKPVKLIHTYENAKDHMVHHLDETPESDRGIEFWSSVGWRALGAIGGDLYSIATLGITAVREMKQSILRVPRIKITPMPQPSESFRIWVDLDEDSGFDEPKLNSLVGFEDENGDIRTEYLYEHPEVESEFNNWLIVWKEWASRTREDQIVSRLYSKLFTARDLLKSQSQDWELILGIGRLRLGSNSQTKIDRHLFTTSCFIDLDPDTGTIYVRIDQEAGYQLEDDWIQGFTKPDLVDLEILQEQLNSAEHLDSQAIKPELAKLAHKFRAGLLTDGEVTSTNEDSLTISPAIILRRRSKQDLIKLIETLETKLAATSILPAPVQAWLEPGFGEQTASGKWSDDGAAISLDDDTYLPLSLNSQQLKALKSADTRNATVVQGPPGTGKTRTIAVMVSHFLAKGQRVLVSAQTPQALREIRAQLPKELQELAVTNLGGTKSDNDELQKSVNALVAAHENRALLNDGFESFQETSLAQLSELHSTRAGIYRQIINLRAQEVGRIEVDGFSGSPAELALIHFEQHKKYSWVEDISSEGAPTPRYGAAEAEKIRNELIAIWSDPIEFDSALTLPGIDEIWSPTEFEELLRLQNSFVDAPLKFETSIATSLLPRISEALVVEDTMVDSNRPWWIDRLQDVRNFKASDSNRIVLRAKDLLDALPEVIAQMGPLNEVNCPNTELTWLPTLEALRKRLLDKGNLPLTVSGEIKKPLVQNNLLKIAIPLLNRVKISGRSPSTVVDVDRIRAHVDFDHIMRSYLESMGINQVDVPVSRADQNLWLLRELELIDEYISYERVVNGIVGELESVITNFKKQIDGQIDLQKLQRNCESLLLEAEIYRLENRKNEIIAKLNSSRIKKFPTEVSDFLEAISQPSAEKYAHAYQSLTSYIFLADRRRQFEEFVRDLSAGDDRFNEGVVSWAREVPDTKGQQEILQRVSDLVAAFTWRRLAEAVNGLTRGSYSELFSKIRNCDQAIEDLIKELARRRAWKKALQRIDPKTLRNMNAYAYESRKLGSGKGKTADRRKRDIRNYLNESIQAVPAWIMPIDSVAKFFPADLELFDVVIVDEASQARLDSLFLIAMAKRIVIVGDDKQVSPDPGMISSAEIEQLADRHLGHNSRKANWSNPDISLFDEGKIYFGNTVTLTEHRRCVPEIIGFSNQIAYQPSGIPLVPVRQRGSEGLLPIRSIYVENGYVKSAISTSGSEVNEPEADVIVNEISKMIGDSRYDGQSIGVVTLQGNRQQEVIRRKLLERIDPSEIEFRQIRVGMPPDFQGSERNVILLSMVMAPNKRFNALTPERMVQRYNVAASRAKDQLILVHSLKSEDLQNPKDLRKQLIDYCVRMESTVSQSLDDSVGIVSEEERVSPFDSIFEQRVHNRIVSRGYTVIPQFEPGIDNHNYRIDLVVVGPHGKFAVECDGDYWHGGEEQFVKDLARQETLQRSGWPFFRITESSFYTDPNALDELWERLATFVQAESHAIQLDEALIEPVENVEVGMDDFDEENESAQDLQLTLQVEPELSEVVDADFSTSMMFLPPRYTFLEGVRVREFSKPLDPRYFWLHAYRSWDPEKTKSLNRVVTASESLLQDLLEIVSVEGPILGSHLMRVHYKATGGSSLSANTESLYQFELKKLINRGYLLAEEQISGESISSATFRLPDQPMVITRVRGNRELYSIPPLEVAMILRGVLQTEPHLYSALSKDQLYRSALSLLDFTKLTGKAEEFLNRIVANYSSEIHSR